MYFWVSFIYHIAYKCRQHYIAGWSVTRWLVIIAFLLPPFLYVIMEAWGLISAIVASLFSLSLLSVLWLAKHNKYLVFLPYDFQEIPPPLKSLQPMKKIAVHASGHFSVQNKNRYFVKEQAYYQKFETGGQVVMVFIRSSRFAWISQSDYFEHGWWYTFFSPNNIIALESTKLMINGVACPTLKFVYQPDGVEEHEILYLSFDEDEDYRCVWADLQ